MSSAASIVLHAHAKVNLALAVGPPEAPRGYHRIASWFVPIDLHDDVRVERLAPGMPSQHEIRWAASAPRPTPIDWPIEKDLGVRAHRLLERHVGRDLPVAMTVEKRVPVGGGLGGGSSDAAAALMGVNRVHGLGMGAGELQVLSTELGADVAFFLDEARADGRGEVPRSGMVTGFGEHIERTASPRGTLLLFFPTFGCPTGAVYKAFDAAPTEGVDDARVRRIIEQALGAGGMVDGHALFNDLAAPACVVAPQLRRVWDGLQRACGDTARVHLTGSGSTMFALVQPERAESLRERCGNVLPEVAVIVARLIGG